MADFGVTLTGLRELEQALRELPDQIAKRTLKGAIRKGGEILKAEIQHNAMAPGIMRTGELAESVEMVFKRNQPTLDPVLQVGFKRPGLSYAHLVELGTRPHILGGAFSGAFHPGAKPKPFIRPALAAKGDEVRETIMAELARGIERAARRLAKRQAG